MWMEGKLEGKACKWGLVPEECRVPESMGRLRIRSELRGRPVLSLPFGFLVMPLSADEARVSCLLRSSSQAKTETRNDSEVGMSGRQAAKCPFLATVHLIGYIDRGLTARTQREAPSRRG